MSKKEIAVAENNIDHQPIEEGAEQLGTPEVLMLEGEEEEQALFQDPVVAEFIHDYIF